MVIEEHSRSWNTLPFNPGDGQTENDGEKHTVVLNLRSLGIITVIISLLVICTALLFSSFGSLPPPTAPTIDTMPPSLHIPKENPKITSSSRRPVVLSTDDSQAAPETIGAQYAPDVGMHDSWVTVNPVDVGSWNREECTRPQCKWISKYLMSKLDWTIKPCHDFYSHVCSAKWFGPNEASVDRMDFRSQNIAMLMQALDAYINEKTSSSPWQRNAATFYKQCLDRMTARTLSSLTPRFPKWPLTEITSSSTLARLSAYCKRYFKVDPLLVSYLGGVGAEVHNFTRYVTSPILPHAKFQLLYPQAQEEDYLARIRSLIPGPDSKIIAQEILKLEVALSKITSREFVSLADRVLRVPHLSTGVRAWDLLLEALTSNRQGLRTLDFRYTSHLMAVIRNTSSPLDAANFIIYSALLHLSPLIKGMSSLIPLGIDETVTGVPIHVQGCLRLTEKAYERGMRILALNALGVNDWSPQQPKATAILGLVSELKQALVEYVEVWFADRQSRKRVLRLLRTLKVDLLGATPHDEIVYARAERTVKDPRDIVSCLESSATRDMPTDSFFPGSVFSPSPKYFAETHTLYLPPAFFGLVNNLSEISDPLYLPLIGAPILKAMMTVVDIRGAQIFIDKLGTTTNWWTASDDLKYSEKAECFRNLYKLALKELLLSTNKQVFLEEFVAQGAILGPLYRVFKKRVALYYPSGLRINPEFTADMLFFTVYAMGLCEIPGREKYKVKHRVGIPSRILVNAILGTNRRFLRAFGCTTNDEMVPSHSCSYWK